MLIKLTTVSVEEGEFYINPDYIFRVWPQDDGGSLVETTMRDLSDEAQRFHHSTRYRLRLRVKESPEEIAARMGGYSLSVKK